MKRIFVLFLVLIVAYTGCVYYNTFFNAENYFAEAQEVELKDDGRPQASAIQKYNKAIKKCGIVLTDYKDTKYADDALFMLARSLYYIGRNYTQSIEKFEDLIKFYPDSEFIPDAKIYVARANYKFRRKELAYELLLDFLQKDEYKEEHPKALQQLADYHLQDEEYVEADYYLNQIIEKFPKSDEYDNAFFLKGKARHEAGNHEQSNEVFLALQKSSVPRNLKFDARYYISLNYILLEDYELARKFSKKLLKDEYRESSISKIQLVKARSMAKTGESDKAIQLFESIVLDNKRSKLAAEASYYLGEHYFEDLQNYEDAITSYNKVKSEYSQSDYIAEAVSRSAVASQIIQYNNPNSDLTAEDLVLQQFKLAEFYIEALALPDSALKVYDHIIGQKNDFELRLDTLKLELKTMQSRVDSMSKFENLYDIAVEMRYGMQEETDSLLQANQQLVTGDSLQTNEVQDSIEYVQNIESDSLDITQHVLIDSTEIVKISDSDSLITYNKEVIDTLAVINPAIDDSLAITELVIVDSTDVTRSNVLDSIEAVQNNDFDDLFLNDIMALDSLTFSEEKNNIQINKTNLQAEYNTLNQQIERTELAVVKYSEDFIPFAKFIKLWLYKTVLNDSTKFMELAADLETNYPDNKYTYATSLFIQNQPVEVTTPLEIEQLAEYQKAFDLLDKDTAGALVSLDSIASNPNHKFYLKANYSIGHINYLMLNDSTAAKPYFDNVLAFEESSEYKTEVNKLYTGKNYKTLTRLPYLDQLEKAAKDKEQEILERAEEESNGKDPKEEKDKGKEQKKSTKSEEGIKGKSVTADELKPVKEEQVEHIPLPEKTESKSEEILQNEIEKPDDQKQIPEKTEEIEQEVEVEIVPEKEDKESEVSEPKLKIEEEPADSTATDKKKDTKNDKKKKSNDSEDEEETDTSGENQQPSGNNEN